MYLKFISFLCLSLIASTQFAQAAASKWHETEGGRVRLISSGKYEAGSPLRVALQIELTQGWKTYWREPGSSGVPPKVDLRGQNGEIIQAEIGFPVPVRFDTGGGEDIGYVRNTALTLLVSPKAEAPVGPIDAEVFLGFCKDICVPFQASLTLDPNQRADDLFDQINVTNAFNAIPPMAKQGQGIVTTRIENEMLRVETSLETSTEKPELFLDGGSDLQFGTPEMRDNDGSVLFLVPLGRHKAGLTSHLVNYTLSNGIEALRGTFSLN